MKTKVATEASERSRLVIRSRFDLENDVTLTYGDSLKLLSKIPDKSAQLVVTSPPYNLGKKYEKKRTKDEYLHFQRSVIAETIRITKDGGNICWQVGNFVGASQNIYPLDILLHPIFEEYYESDKLRLRNRIIWHFEHGLHCQLRFSGRYETILWYTKGLDYPFNLDPVRVPQKYPGKRGHKGPKQGKLTGNPLGKNPGDVWIFPNVKSNHVEKTVHPCQFPVELPERLILALTNPHDLVVDPFIGVGSTAVAAVLNGRRVAGADTEAEYIRIARSRVKEAEKGDLRYRKRNTPVYVMSANTPLRTIPEEFVIARNGNGYSGD
jgi:adenine-specific DNA-methyltransferase